MTKKRGLLVIGAGGLAKQMLDDLKGCYKRDALLFLDEVHIERNNFFEYPLWHNFSETAQNVGTQQLDFCIAVAKPVDRENIYKRFLKLHLTPFNLISKLSSVSKNGAILGNGIGILSGAIVESGSSIDDGVLINVAASIHHDAIIGAFSEIGPGARILGGAAIGRRCSLGANCVILPGINVGSDCIVGAGAVVTKDVEPGCLVMGVPAKFVRKVY